MAERAKKDSPSKIWYDVTAPIELIRKRIPNKELKNFEILLSSIGVISLSACQITSEIMMNQSKVKTT